MKRRRRRGAEEAEDEANGSASSADDDDAENESSEGEHGDEEEEEEEEEEEFRGVAEGAVELEEEKRRREGGVVFVLQRASLEVGKVGRGYTVLNCDDHKAYLRRHKKDPALYRPDIVHQALLAILDSPLNKAGRVRHVYVQTEQKVLFSVSPHTRLPRTFRRFCGLMTQLLQKLSVRAVAGAGAKSVKLLKVIKQPVTRHLPPGARRVGLSVSASLPSRGLQEFADDQIEATDATVFVAGAMAHGKIDESYCDEMLAVSAYPLSAMCAIGRLCSALERKWDIV